jgi:di/tricarboxylate transporter
MTFEIGLAFALLIGAFVIFALDVFAVDFVAFGVMVAVLILGPIFEIGPEEALSGFSNPATITVLAMFILSGGIYQTGLINLLAQRMSRFAGPGELRQLLTVMLVSAPISAFINNTAAVAILIPSVISMARNFDRSPSKLLMPLSFFAQLAGVATLIGTSTNILASFLSAQEGYGTFGIFEFAHIGLLVFATGSLYILFVGRKLLPERQANPKITQKYRMKEYLSDVVILDKSPLAGRSVVESELREQFDIHVLDIFRGDQKLSHPLGNQVLQVGDILFVKANTDRLLGIKDIEGLAIATEIHWDDQTLEEDKRSLLEVVVGPSSDLIGGTLESTNFRHHYNCVVIALRKHGELIRDQLSKEVLHFGDTLLLRGTTAAIEQIKREPGFIITEEIELETFRTHKAWTALVIVAAVVVFAVFGVPILVSGLAGCLLMVLTGCLKTNELHDSIRWDVIFLLAGVIPLGLVLERSGGAALLASLAAQSAAYTSPIVVLGVFYIITMALTGIISNNATVVVMVPVGVATANTLGLDPRAFVLAIMFAASTSFYSPVGYQTNTMVFGIGGYRFLDFTRVGLPLNILLAIVTPIFIYFLWGV